MTSLSPPRVAWRDRLNHFLSRFFEQRWFNLGLRAKMGFMVEIGVIGITVTFLLLGVSNARQATTQILNERMTLARLSAATLDATLRNIQGVLSMAAGHHFLRDPQADPLLREKALQDAFSQISSASQGLYLFDPHGNLTIHVADPGAGLQPPHLSQALQPVSTGGTASQLVLLPGDPPYVVVAVPVIGLDGVPAGLLAAVMDLSQVEFAPFQNWVNLGETGTLDVVNASGRVLISSSPERSLTGGVENLTGVPDPALQKLFVAGEPVVETCLGCAFNDLEGSGDEVIAFAPLNQAPWGVVVRQKAAELMSPVNRLLIQTLLLGLAMIIGALGLVWVTTNSVIQPVQVLTEAAERITSGDLTTPLVLPGRSPRGDEIGALAESFKSMRRQLKQSMDEVNALNRELDQRVQERTQAALSAQHEAQAARDSLERRNQQLSILNAIAAVANQSLDLEEILQKSLDAILGLTGVDIGAVFLLDEVRGDLTLMAYRGISEEAARLAAEVGMLDGSCGGVLEHGHLVIVPDLSRYHGRRARSLQREHLSTLVHVPLTAKGYTLGSMCVGTHRPYQVDQEEQDLLVAIGSQIAVAVENARLYAEVQHKERLRGELFRKAINAQEEERRRIARELHDETSQSLAALIYAIDEAREMKNMAQARLRLKGMAELTQHTLDGVHKIIFDLRPSLLDHLGLIPALRGFATSRLEPKGMRVVVEELQPVAGQGQAEECCPRLPAEVETALFRVGQEAITNIARHAAARNVTITLAHEGSAVNLCVEDDGIGFNPNDLSLAPDSPRGLGLLGMQERLELLGGRLDIVSNPGSGARLEIHIPLAL